MSLSYLNMFVKLSFGRRPLMISRANQSFVRTFKCSAVNSEIHQFQGSPKLRVENDIIHSMLDEKISLCSGPSDLLATINDHKLSTYQMVKAIENFGRWKEKNVNGIDKILKDDRFSQLCLNMESEVSTLSGNNLINLLKNLLTIGLSSESYVIKSLEHEVLWRIRKMSLRQISYCLSFHKDFMVTDQQREVVLELVDAIQKRWFDIHDSADLLRILRLSSMLREESISKIHDRALDLVGKMSVDVLQKLFVTLAELKQRPTPLLRAIMYHLKQSEDKIPVRKLMNLTYAMYILNFRDCDFLDRVTDDLLPEVSGIKKSTIVSSFLTALGHLQYCNTALMEQFSNWIKNNLDVCRHQDLCTFVLTLGRLNYVPVEDPTILNVVIDKLDKESTPPKVWLDVVWSLVNLQKADNQHLASVLDSTFYRALIDKDDHATSVKKLKLLNINAAAKFDVQGYTGPYLLYEPTLEDVQHKFTNDELLMHKSVIETLSQVVPFSKGLKTDIMTKMGIHIDAEFVVNSCLESRSSSDNITVIEMKGPQQLAGDLHRVALFVWTYRDLTLNTSIPTGVNTLATRIMKKLGYSVVEIFYNEVTERMTSEQKINFIKKKILQSIGNLEH